MNVSAGAQWARCLLAGLVFPLALVTFALTEEYEPLEALADEGIGPLTEKEGR